MLQAVTWAEAIDVWAPGNPTAPVEPLPCPVEGCGAPVVLRGLCGKHEIAWRRFGDPRGCMVATDEALRIAALAYAETRSRTTLVALVEAAVRYQASRRNGRKAISSGRLRWTLALARAARRYLEAESDEEYAAADMALRQAALVVGHLLNSPRRGGKVVRIDNKRVSC